MKIGPYRVVRELGQGGMASVALARAPNGRLVVLKRPLREDPDLDARLYDEARAGLRISHPHVVETIDHFEHEARPVLVVSYVPGLSLDRLLRLGKLSGPVVCRVGRQIASALHAIHTATNEWGESLHMVHRDVSPSNIMLGHDGDACLIDLGIVRSMESMSQRTATGFLRGKLRYLAPELFDGKSYSAVSDLWALGVVLAELALGRSMFRGSCQQEVVGQIVSGRVLDLGQHEVIEPGLLEVLRRLLAADPKQRVQSGQAASLLFARLETRYGDTRPAAVASMPHPAAAQAVSVEPAPPKGGAMSLATGSWDVLPSTSIDVHSDDVVSEPPIPWAQPSTVHTADLDGLSSLLGSEDLGSLDDADLAAAGFEEFDGSVVTLTEFVDDSAPSGAPARALLHDALSRPIAVSAAGGRRHRVPAPLPMATPTSGKSPADMLLDYARLLRGFESGPH